MATRYEIILPEPLLERCADWGRALVAYYAADPKRCALSSHGAERNAALLAQSKAGECAYALHCKLDPPDAVKWDVTAPDHGWDIFDPVCRRFVDVKTIDMNKRYLIWPINKAEFYSDKKFDLFVLVKAEAPRFVIWGWVTKGYFREFKRIADFDDGTGLMPGTWYLRDDKLGAMDDLHDSPGARA